MRRASAAALLAGPIILAGGQPGRAQSANQPVLLQRTVPRDAETRVASEAAYKTYDGTTCLVRYLPTIQLVVPPQHGTVRFDTADVGVPAGSGCRNSVTGTVVLYRPNAGFIGKDQFTYKTQVDPVAMDRLGPGNPLHSLTVMVQ